MPSKKNKAVSKSNSLFFPLTIVAFILSLSLFLYYQYSYKPNLVKHQQAQSSQPSSQALVLSEPISLPKVQLTSKTSVETAINQRRSVRAFTADHLNLKQISQLLWAAQGVTSDWGGRAAPSAKSAYPLTVYLVATNVDGLNPGIYQYIPGDKQAVHQIQLIKSGNFQEAAAKAIGQSSAKEPPALLIISGDFQKMAKAFDDKRVDSNVYLEVGHAAQNVYLEAVSLGLGTVTIAGFDSSSVQSLLGLTADSTPIYAMPLGYPKK